MKNFLLATVGLVAMAGMAAPASAADMAVKAAPPPIVAPIYNWTGFYIGANGGWGQSHSCVDFLNATGVAVAQGCRDRSGGLFGGQLGYRWQSSQWVFGLEAQGDWADLSNQRLSLVNPSLSTRTKTSGIGLFTGQIGYAWNASLFYVKGGAAVTDTRFSILDTPTGAELAAGQCAVYRADCAPDRVRRVQILPDRARALPDEECRECIERIARLLHRVDPVV